MVYLPTCMVDYGKLVAKYNRPMDPSWVYSAKSVLLFCGVVLTFSHQF